MSYVPFLPSSIGTFPDLLPFFRTLPFLSIPPPSFLGGLSFHVVGVVVILDTAMVGVVTTHLESLVVVGVVATLDTEVVGVTAILDTEVVGEVPTHLESVVVGVVVIQGTGMMVEDSRGVTLLLLQAVVTLL